MSETALIAVLGVRLSMVAVLVPRIVKWTTRRQRRRTQAGGGEATGAAAREELHPSGRHVPEDRAQSAALSTTALR